MSRNLHFAAAVLGTALALGCTQRDESPAGPETGPGNAGIDAVFTPWNVAGSPGCAVAVARDGAVFYSRGYGYANLDYDIPVTPRSVFDVASINKQFVAAMLNMLALDGVLSLDDDIRNWLPELPEYEWPITLRHMLYHTSGLRDYLNLFPLAGRSHYYPISHAQILAMMSRQRELIFPPGEQYLYSNTAFMLLAQVIERASGKTLGEFAEERIFAPLGMQDSLMYDNYEEIIVRRATGYDRHDDGDIRMVHNFNFDVPGDGQLYSTVEDLLRWDNFLHGVVKPAFYQSMLTEGTLNNGDPIERGQGLFLGEYRGLRTVHHTGSSWGSRAMLVRFLKPALSIAVACNDGNASAGSLAWQVADHYLADQLAPRSDAGNADANQPAADAGSEPLALSAEQLAEFTGAFYAPELDATYRFTLVDGRLVVRIEQEPPVGLVPLAADRFRFSFDEQAYTGVLSASLGFDRDIGGTVKGFDLSSGTERGIVFVKLH